MNFLAKIPDNPVDFDLDPQPMVYCHDLGGLLCHIAAERKVEVTDLLKPQDLKIPRRRRRRSDVLSRQDKAAFGVNNLIILAASPAKSEK